ncbi:MAG: hypothetical protein HEQ38_17070 [Gemmatimonas sp.]|nr:hypothetical protein [Gemmatimonas sp.]
MPIQLSTPTRNRHRDAYLAAFPAGSLLQIRSGAPAGVANVAGGTLLAEITLPTTPFTSGTGQVALNGTWQDGSANATGNAGHYRLVNGTDIEEGTVTGTGGGGDMTLDNVSIAAAQVVTVTGWTRAMPGA